MKYLFFSFLFLFVADSWAADASNPIRKISIIATEDGFYPSSIPVFKGEIVKLFVTTTQRKGCLFIDDKSIFLTLENGKISETQFKSDGYSNISFTCPVTNISGKFVTLVNKKNHNHQYESSDDFKRGPASFENKFENFWVPKEE